MNQTDFLLEGCYKGVSNIKNDSLIFKPLPCGRSLILQHKLALGTGLAFVCCGWPKHAWLSVLCMCVGGDPEG